LLSEVLLLGTLLSQLFPLTALSFPQTYLSPGGQSGHLRSDWVRINSILLESAVVSVLSTWYGDFKCVWISLAT
jgi:hypothetical protein